MAIPDTGTLVVFALGILVGGILFSPDFRVKFFKGFRHFLAGVGQGAKQTNSSVKGTRKATQEKPEVQHVWKETHTRKVCPTCEGRFVVPAKTIPLQEGAIGYRTRMVTCPTCKGEGKVWD